MTRKPGLEDDKLYAVAMYLARPETQTEIHAEVPKRHRKGFESEYGEATKGWPIPETGADRKGPYYIWSDDTNKQGRELRIYFMPSAPEPPIVGTLTDHGKPWHARETKQRINHSNLVMQLFKCGFVLGSDQNSDRIRDFMSKRFPAGECS